LLLPLGAYSRKENQWPTRSSASVPQHDSCGTKKKTKPLIPNGEPGWDRTNDHLIKSQMLYR
jgi:hypothetical protein